MQEIQNRKRFGVPAQFGCQRSRMDFFTPCFVISPRDNPRQPFTVVIEGIIGKVPGKILASLYTLFFIYQASRQFNDFALLMSVSVFEQTPIIMIHAMMVVAIGYVLW